MRPSAVVLASSFLFIMTFCVDARAQPDDAARIRRSLLAELAARISSRAPAYNDPMNGRLSPAADAEWTNLLRELSDAGLRAQTGGGLSAYRGVLQRDLPDAAANTNLCRMRVAEDLANIVPVSREAPQRAARRSLPTGGIIGSYPPAGYGSAFSRSSGRLTADHFAAPHAYENPGAAPDIRPDMGKVVAKTDSVVRSAIPRTPIFSPPVDLAQSNPHAGNPSAAPAPSAPPVTHHVHHHAEPALDAAATAAGPGSTGGSSPAALALHATATANSGGSSSAASAQSAATPNQVVAQFAATRSDLVAELESLAPGQIVFNPPDTMTEGESVPVDVRIATQTNQAVLGRDLEGPGTAQYASLPVGSTMKVELAGDGFKTELEGAEKSGVQPVLPGAPYAEWIFDVTPTDSGTKYLNLRASVQLIEPDGLPTYEEFPVLKRVIKVHVSPMGLLLAMVGDSSQWRWVLGGIGSVIMVAGGYLGKRWLDRRG